MRKCCIVGCRSGYDNNTEKISVFKIPSEEKLRGKWLLAIGRSDFKPSNYSGVCEKHFLENEIVRHQLSVNKETGADILLPTKARLKHGVVPTLNLDKNVQVKLEPGYQSSKTTSLFQKSPERRSSLSSSSDEDVPLGNLRNRLTASQSDSSGSDGAIEAQMQRKLASLLSQYEKLKDKHVALGQAIDVLERINIELKCKIFKC